MVFSVFWAISPQMRTEDVCLFHKFFVILLTYYHNTLWNVHLPPSTKSCLMRETAGPSTLIVDQATGYDIRDSSDSRHHLLKAFEIFDLKFLIVLKAML